MVRSERIRIVVIMCAIAASCSLAWGKYGGGTGTADDPYLIYTAEQMDGMASQWRDWDKHFKLMADIDLSGYTGNQYHIIGFNWQGSFSGTFDGNGKTVSHFTYACADANCVGLFGWVGEKGRIENLGLIDPNITAVRGYDVGSLAGVCSGTITNCYVRNATISGKQGVGGLVGIAGTMSNCHATGTVTGVLTVGGLAGGVQQTVTRCSATAKVTGDSMVGGLAGYSDARLGGCFSEGSALGDNNVGGLLGGNSDVMSNCYSICDVNGRDIVGGLAGGSSWASTTVNCFSAGKVRGKLHTGGLIGMDVAKMTGILNAVRGCFWDTQTSGQAASDGGTGLSTTRMKTAQAFLDAGWDFTDETANGSGDLWRMPEKRGYPKLSWEPIPVVDPNAAASLPADDFEDRDPAPQWTPYQPADGQVSVQEINGRLEVSATARAEDSIAFFVSDGWGLDATQDFEVKVDFHFSRSSVGEARVLMGLTPNSAEPVSQWVAVEAGCFNRKPFYRGEVRDGYSVQTWTSDRSINDGILYISYDSVADELYLSGAGYGKENATQTVTGVLKGRWLAGSVRVILGGGSTSMALTEGEAWLDNFAVDSGVVIW